MLVPAERSMNDWLRLIALIYLGIGLYVLLRRWTAVGSLHFYIFCLVSFVFYSLHFTGKLNTFDWIVLWSNEVAWLLQPALFLHFVLTFPERRAFVSRHRWSIPLLYLPGAVLLGIQILALQFLQASARLLWNLNRVHWAYLTIFFVSAAVVLWNNYRQAATPILRQQLKWITRGTVLAITPFTALLRAALPVRRDAFAGDEGDGAVAGTAAAHLRLRHRPLPADGRGSDLQARHGVYAGGGGDCGRILRRRGRHCRTGAHARAQFRAPTG